MNSDNYGIKPMSQTSSAFVWRYSSKEQALRAAESLAKEYNCDVLVYQIIGQFRRQTQW